MTDVRPNDPDLEVRLRATLDAAAPADTHVAAGLTDLRSRLDGATVVSLRTARPLRRRRVALVAAAVALLAAAAGAALIARGEDDGGREIDVTTPSGAEATGWYVPEDLPDGWVVSEITSDHRDVEGFDGTCPCPSTTWVADEGIGLLTWSSAANEAPATPGAPGPTFGPEPVQLDGGVPAFISSSSDDWHQVRWAQDGRHHQLVGRGLTADELVEHAGDLAAGPASRRTDPAPPSGYSVLRRTTAPGGIRAYRAITVTLRHDDRDVWTSYTLVPDGLGQDLVPLTLPEPVEVAGFPGSDLLRFGGAEEAPAASNSIFVGRLPGAELVLGDDPHGEVGERYPTDEDLQQLLASLRPVDAEGWRRFVATAAEPADEATTVAPTIADLATPGEAQTD